MHVEILQMHFVVMLGDNIYYVQKSPPEGNSLHTPAQWIRHSSHLSTQQNSFSHALGTFSMSFSRQTLHSWYSPTHIQQTETSKSLVFWELMTFGMTANQQVTALLIEFPLVSLPRLWLSRVKVSVSSQQWWALNGLNSCGEWSGINGCEHCGMIPIMCINWAASMFWGWMVCLVKKKKGEKFGEPWRFSFA